jgi:hypothetical protein
MGLFCTMSCIAEPCGWRCGGAACTANVTNAAHAHSRCRRLIRMVVGFFKLFFVGKDSGWLRDDEGQ